MTRPRPARRARNSDAQLVCKLPDAAHIKNNAVFAIHIVPMMRHKLTVPRSVFVVLRRLHQSAVVVVVAADGRPPHCRPTCVRTLTPSVVAALSSLCQPISMQNPGTVGGTVVMTVAVMVTASVRERDYPT